MITFTLLNQVDTDLVKKTAYDYYVVMKRSHRMCSNKLNTKLVTGEQLSSRQERILANEISCNIRETRVWLESLARSCEHDIPRLNVELKNLMVNLDFNKETRLYVCAYRTIVEEFRAKTM